MLLFAIVLGGILTLWVPARWALTAFQVAMLALAVSRLIRRRSLTFDASGIAIAAVIACGAVQVLAGWTVDAFRTQEAMLGWTVNLVGFSLALEFDRTRREQFLTYALAFATGLSVLAMLTAFSSAPGVIAWWVDVGSQTPTLGPFVYRNQYAAFVEALLPVALLRAFTDRDRTWAYVSAAGLLFASVVAAGSRTGTVLCAVEVLLVPLLVGGRGVWRIVLGIIASVGGLTLVAGWQFLWSRFQESNPFGLRWDLFRSSIEMWRARPITGWGLGTWSEVYPGFASYDDGSFVNQAHNDWAQWAVEGGSLVFLLILFVALRVARPAWHSVWGIGILAVLVHCAVDYPMQQRPALATFFFVMLGMTMMGGDLRSTLKSELTSP